MAAEKTPREHLYEARTIAVKPVVVEALRRKHAALRALREERTGKKRRAGISPPILPAAIILSGLLVYEKKYSKAVVTIRNAKWMESGLTKNDIERGEQLLIECGFVEKHRAGYKGAKHYIVDHRAIAEQIVDPLAPVEECAFETSKKPVLNPTHKSETETHPESDTAPETESNPESDMLVGNRNPTHKSESDLVCTSIYEPKDGLIDRRARERERDGNSSVTGDRSIEDIEKPLEKSPNHEKAKGSKGNVSPLNDFEEQVKGIPEAALTDVDKHFGQTWSTKLGDIKVSDLARLSHMVGAADRRRMENAAKTCVANLEVGRVDLPWRYLLKCAATLVEKRSRDGSPTVMPAPSDLGPDGRMRKMTPEEIRLEAAKYNFRVG